jgi:hypothetical protein
MHGTPGAHGEHASPQTFPAQGSYGAQTGGAVTQPPESVQYPRSDGIRHGGLASRHGGSMVQRAPHVFPAHGSAAGQVKVPRVAHAPVGSQAVAANVGHGFARPHGLQAAPHACPAQSAAPQVNVPWATHAPLGSHAFTSAVSKQLRSSGAQTVQPAPHAFPAQGS